MTNSNDSDRAYLIEKGFANFTKSITEQQNDPNRNDESNYDSDLEYEPEEDYDAGYNPRTKGEICFASTKEIKPKEPKKNHCRRKNI